MGTHIPGTTNAIAPLLSAADVLFDVDASDSRALLGAIGRLFERRHALSAQAVADGLGAREKLGSTGLGHGVAIPHARVKGLRNVVAAVVHTRLAIAFDAPDGKPVTDFAVLLIPERATEEHLRTLAAIAEMFADREIRAALRSCADERELLGLYGAWPNFGGRKNV